MKVYICDKCNEPKTAEDIYEVTIHNRSKGDMRVDLCFSCFKGLADYLRGKKDAEGRAS